jgi:formate-dependent nitrite reductase membrane component NrfD
MTLERQNSWGVLAALDMFLGGIGAGAFAVGFMLRLLGEMEWLAVTGMVLGPVFVATGMIFLLLEAGSSLKSYRLLQGLSTSWMSRGGLIQILFIIFGLGYALPGFWLPEWLGSGGGIAVGSVALVLALAIAAYHGMIMSQARAIPLWSSSVLPLLSFFTALCTGLGILLSISPAYTGLYSTNEVVVSMGKLGIAGIALIIGKLITTWYLVSSSPNDTYVASIRSMRAAIIADVVCLILALFLLSFGLAIGEETFFMWTSLVSGALLLAGGFIIRYSILRAGYYAPIQILL